MTQPLKVGRRYLLQLLSGLAVVRLPARAHLDLDHSPPSPSHVSDLVNLLRSADSATIVGAEYLRQFPEEKSISLLADLVGGVPTAALTTPGSQSQATKNLSRRGTDNVIRRHLCDFETGRIVTLQGWVLSRTEARLCALVALHSEASAAASVP